MPPIFIAEGHDVSAFCDVIAAESWLEPIDVDDGAFEAWDAEGRVLSIATIPGQVLGARAVRITLEGACMRDGGLRELLTNVLRAGGAQLVSVEPPLREVVAEFIKRVGYRS